MALRTCNGRGNILSRGDARVPPLPPSSTHDCGHTHAHSWTTSSSIQSAHHFKRDGSTTHMRGALFNFGERGAARRGSRRSASSSRECLPRLQEEPGGGCRPYGSCQETFPPPPPSLICFFFIPGNLGILQEIVERWTVGRPAPTIRSAQKGTLCNSSGSYLGTPPAVCFAHHPDTHSDAMTRQICN